MDENGFLQSYVNESTRSVFGVGSTGVAIEAPEEDPGEEDNGANHDPAAEDGNEEHLEEQGEISDNAHAQGGAVAAAEAEVGNIEGEIEEQEEDDGNNMIFEVSLI